jgi:hypothetical protein
MEQFKNQLLNIENGNLTKEQLVSILLLCVSKLEINTISETARQEKKTPRGILISNQYNKINIGKQKFVIKNMINNGLPF